MQETANQNIGTGVKKKGCRRPPPRAGNTEHCHGSDSHLSGETAPSARGAGTTIPLVIRSADRWKYGWVPSCCLHAFKGPDRVRSGTLEAAGNGEATRPLASMLGGLLVCRSLARTCNDRSGSGMRYLQNSGGPRRARRGTRFEKQSQLLHESHTVASAAGSHGRHHRVIVTAGQKSLRNVRQDAWSGAAPVARAGMVPAGNPRDVAITKPTSGTGNLVTEPAKDTGPPTILEESSVRCLHLQAARRAGNLKGVRPAKGNASTDSLSARHIQQSTGDLSLDGGPATSKTPPGRNSS